MPTYHWSCLACGTTNENTSNSCGGCHCPAEATAVQVSDSRASFLAAGGQLRGAAAEAVVEDLSAVDVLVKPLAFCLLGGWWPSKADRK